jgi:DNA polymerase-3 subunit alpha
MIHQNLITELNDIFKTYKGDNTVTFEIMELEKVKIFD